MIETKNVINNILLDTIEKKKRFKIKNFNRLCQQK